MSHEHESTLPIGHYRAGDFPAQVRPGLSLVESAIQVLLVHCGEDPNREGLKETPARYAKALSHYCSGYGYDDEKVGLLLKTFEDGADGYDEMVAEAGIPFYSLCEHHLAPFMGVAHVAYIPNGKVVGLSKLVRLVEVFSRRLQVQERLTVQIANALVKHLNPLGAGVMMEARHLCMECRGVQKPNVITRTSALRGLLKTDPAARQEFLALCRTKR